MDGLIILGFIFGILIGFIIGGETRWWIVWRQSDRQTWLDWQNISNRWKAQAFNWKDMYEGEKTRHEMTKSKIKEGI